MEGIVDLLDSLYSERFEWQELWDHASISLLRTHSLDEFGALEARLWDCPLAARVKFVARDQIIEQFSTIRVASL